MFLKCCSPVEIKYSWVFNRELRPLQQDARRFISQKTGNLYIAKVEAPDAGNYTCAVRNMMTNSSEFSSPTPLVVRRDGKEFHLLFCSEIKQWGMNGGFIDILLPGNVSCFMCSDHG